MSDWSTPNMIDTDAAAAEVWQGARTLTDLAELTAQWIEGRIEGHPGYGGGRPNAETERIAAPLAALGRAGWLTIGSQPGEHTLALCGRTYLQRAAVELLVDEVQLETLLAAPGVAAIDALVSNGSEVRLLGPVSTTATDDSAYFALPVSGFARPGGGIDVTCSFGGQPWMDDELEHLFSVTDPDLLDQLCRTWTVALAAPWGETGTELWEALLGLTTQTPTDTAAAAAANQ